MDVGERTTSDGGRAVEGEKCGDGRGQIGG